MQQAPRWLEDNSTVYTPGAYLLVSGDLSWEGDLKQGQPVEFFASIKLPEEGDWEIHAYGNSLESEAANKGGFGDYIKMTIGRGRSSFGWEERPAKTHFDDTVLAGHRPLIRC